jgi:hypothetical protein
VAGSLGIPPRRRQPFGVADYRAFWGISTADTVEVRAGDIPIAAPMQILLSDRCIASSKTMNNVHSHRTLMKAVQEKF